MKTLLITFAFALSAAAAQAELRCQDINGGPDHGYAVLINKKVTKAKISETTIAGPRVLANLRCELTKERAQYPDQIITFAHCSEPELRDAGYSLVIKTGGFAGLTTAELSQITLAGAEPITSLICR